MVRVFTIDATFFHSLPYLLRALVNNSCSFLVHRPVASDPEGQTTYSDVSSSSSSLPVKLSSGMSLNVEGC